MTAPVAEELADAILHHPTVLWDESTAHTLYEETSWIRAPIAGAIPLDRACGAAGFDFHGTWRGSGEVVRAFHATTMQGPVVIMQAHRT